MLLLWLLGRQQGVAAIWVMREVLLLLRVGEGVARLLGGRTRRGGRARRGRLVGVGGAQRRVGRRRVARRAQDVAHGAALGRPAGPARFASDRAVSGRVHE